MSSSSLGSLQKPRHHIGVNKIGLLTLYVKECRRFLTIAAQTLLAPAIVNLLYFTVFSLALKANTPVESFYQLQKFLAPGIVMMTMLTNAFTSVSSAILISKIQGSFIDLLLSPITPFEMTAGFLASGITRGILVGICSFLPLAFLVSLDNTNWLLVFYFGVMGSLWMANLGLIGGIFAQKFDHLNAFSNFIITPLIFLSGTFFSIKALAPVWQQLAHADPFFLIIDGFRFAFLGVSDTSVLTSGMAILITNVFFCFFSWHMIRAGVRIKT